MISQIIGRPAEDNQILPLPLFKRGTLLSGVVGRVGHPPE